jgi:hypothetical protein
MFKRKDGGENRVVLPELNWIKRSKKNPKSLKLAMRAMCFHCIGGTAEEMPDPGWHREIQECTATECPLHSYRPTKKLRGGYAEEGQGRSEGTMGVQGVQDLLGISEDLLGGFTNRETLVLPTMQEGNGGE